MTQLEDRDQVWPALGGLARDLSLEVLIRGPLPRRELAAKFGVSAATLTRTVAPLLESGVLIELEEPLDRKHATRDAFGVVEPVHA